MSLMAFSFACKEKGIQSYCCGSISKILGLVRRVIEACITEKTTPAFVINAFKIKFKQHELLDDLDLLSKVEKTGSLLNKDGACKVVMFFSESRGKFLSRSYFSLLFACSVTWGKCRISVNISLKVLAMIMR